MDGAVLKILAMDLKLDALRKGIRLTFPVIGSSMLPLIRHNDMVEAEGCASNKLIPGDLVIFRQVGDNNNIIAHRLIWKIKNESEFLFITKGDFVLGFDKAVPEGNVLGKIVKIRRRHFTISVNSCSGIALNLVMLLISLAGIMPAAHIFLKKVKGSFSHARLNKVKV